MTSASTSSPLGRRYERNDGSLRARQDRRLLQDAGWDLTDGLSVLFEHALPNGTQADYVLCDRQGRPMAALEAKRASVDPVMAQDQGRHYAEQLGVPFVFLSNGEDVRFLDRETDAHARTTEPGSRATFALSDSLMSHLLGNVA